MQGNARPAGWNTGKGLGSPVGNYQAGMMTTYTCILVLVLMLSMLVYSTRAGLTDQKMSADEVRQKQAFHAAEAGLRHAYEWLSANNVLISADVQDLLGSGVDGWMVAGSRRWVRCGDVDYSSDKSHPCWGDPVDARRDQSWFYYWDGSTELPIDTDAFLQASETEVQVEALLCLLQVDAGLDPALSSVVSGCHTDPALLDGSKFMVTLLARAGADCVNGSCGAWSRVSEQVTSFSVSAFAKLPGVPLVTKSELPDHGVLEIVANLHGGGLNVPASIWANANSGCVGHSEIDPRDAGLITCNALDWYGSPLIPDDLDCGLSLCECPLAEALSYTTPILDQIGPDIVLDDLFPCDLFEFYFGTARTEFTKLRDSVRVIDDCSSLDGESFGTYWVTGSTCEIAANTVVGSPDHPVMLISASSETVMHSGAELYGMLFVTDVEDSDAALRTTGNATVFGSVVMDGAFGHHAGTFQVVYNDDIIADVSTAGGLGNLTGSWTDAHRHWR